jgi:hypothetical protein
MRVLYFQFIKKNNISDILSLIPELSYSYKKKILSSLLSHYTNEQINRALNIYEINYIKKNRVDLNIIYNTLKGIIQRNITN